MIKIENLKLEFPQRFKLCIDKLWVEEGSTLAILGPNGAGKSTLLSIIALFQKPATGLIEISGENILALRNQLRFRRKLSFVFPEAYLLNETVYKNVALPLRLRGIRNTNKVDEMLELFKISQLREYKTSTLSQGQLHRVSLARAFVTEPKLLLLDEPFLSLDQRYKESLSTELRIILKQNKTTTLFVTQDHSEALSLADELAVMKDGRIMQQGEPQEIFLKPSSKEVADFIGIETLLEGKIIKKEDNLCFIKVQDKFLEAVSEYNVGDNVFVCIRPEDVTISPQIDVQFGLSSARNYFKAKIINIEGWGLRYKIILDCGFNPEGIGLPIHFKKGPNLVVSVTKQSIEILNLKIGKETMVFFKATAIHLIRR